MVNMWVNKWTFPLITVWLKDTDWKINMCGLHRIYKSKGMIKAQKMEGAKC